VALHDAMSRTSRQAQAEREKRARVILGSAEAEIAANSSSGAFAGGDSRTERGEGRLAKGSLTTAQMAAY
jgi:hypothetical protein